MPPITPCLWFDSNAEEAVNFYLTVFKNAKITQITHYAKATEKVSGKPAGTVMTIGFEVNGQNFLALNGGNEFSFTPAISLIINCDTQEEIDTYWEKLTAGGQVIECGWLTDKFGITWQVTPTILDELLTSADDAKKERVLAALLTMKKLDIETLKNA